MPLFTPNHILVTGGAGFIGSHFVRFVLGVNEPVQVINLDLLTYAGSKDNLQDLPVPNRHEFIKGDICDGELVKNILRDFNIDTIVHFAAESHVDRSISGPAAFIQTNVNGTFTLLEEARTFWSDQHGLEASRHRFHHISTDEVYGTLGPQDPPFSELTPYAPNSPYSASKAASDHLVRAYQHTYGMSTTTTNCSNNYGPAQHMEKFIPTVIRSCLEGKAIPVYGDGSNIRDWLYVVDHCAAIWDVIRKGRIGETYNIGGLNNINNIEVVNVLCATLADLLEEERETFTDLITLVRDRPGHDWRYAIDATKIQQELQWAPTETFESGIRKTVEYYLKKLSGSPVETANRR